MTVVKVNAGACGFNTQVNASKEDEQRVRLVLKSECEAVQDLGFILKELGPLGIKDVASTRADENRVFEAASEVVRHSACPVPVAVLKAAEVELGLNVPCPVTIEFESDVER